MSDPVSRLLERAAHGHPPPEDGRTEVHPQPAGPVAGIIAFAHHHVVAADVDPDWVRDQLPDGDLSAPVGPGFVSALAGRLGASFDNLDVVLAALGTGARPALDLRPVPSDDHPRIARARRYRTGVRAYMTPDGVGLVVIGRGLAGRWEAAVEVEPGARGSGLGRALVATSRNLVPGGEPLFVQVAPGNAPSLRSVMGAGGFRPIGAEILFVPSA